MQLISAIIPTYNRAALLVRALASVAAQDYRPIEVVVVDDGSTDNTAQIIELQRTLLAAQGINLLYHQQSNGGAPKARNTAMKLATGDLFAFIDSDDLWRPTFLSTTHRLLDSHPSAGLGFCQIVVIDPDDNVIKHRDTGLPAEPREGLLPRPFNTLIRHMPFQTSGVIIRRSVIESLGDFDLNLPVGEDWDLWYRTSRNYDFVYTQEGLACNRIHRDNLPKYSTTALASNLRLNLKHLPEITDAETRTIMENRIRLQILLLQEELMREGASANGYTALLQHDLAPKTMRYRTGGLLRHMPKFVGKAYANLIRRLGEKSRSA